MSWTSLLPSIKLSLVHVHTCIPRIAELEWSAEQTALLANPLAPKDHLQSIWDDGGFTGVLHDLHPPETGALSLMAIAACGQGKEAAEWKDGWCKWISAARTAWMEPSTVTLRPQQDEPSAASTTLTLLMPRDLHWGLWAGGAAFSYIAIVNNTAAAGDGSLGSQSASCRGLCPHSGSEEMCWVCFWAKQKPAPANATVAYRLSSQDLPVPSAPPAKPA